MSETGKYGQIHEPDATGRRYTVLWPDGVRTKATFCIQCGTAAGGGPCPECGA